MTHFSYFNIVMPAALFWSAEIIIIIIIIIIILAHQNNNNNNNNTKDSVYSAVIMAEPL